MENEQIKNQIKKNMRDWFYCNYTNINYVHSLIDVCIIWNKFGEPSSAKEILYQEYLDKYEKENIDELSAELDQETKHWMPQGNNLNETINSLLLETLPINKLKESLNLLQSLLPVNTNFSVKEFLNNMLILGSISALERYLYEEFMRQLILDEAKLNLFIENNLNKKNTNNSSKDKAIKTVFECLVKKVWHRKNEINNLYKSTLGFDFLEKFEDKNILPLALEFRHDIAHRFGNTIDGAGIMLEESDLAELFGAITKFAEFINEKINKK